MTERPDRIGRGYTVICKAYALNIRLVGNLHRLPPGARFSRFRLRYAPEALSSFSCSSFEGGFSEVFSKTSKSFWGGKILGLYHSGLKGRWNSMTMGGEEYTRT
jgi:hypothetical protein